MTTQEAVALAYQAIAIPCILGVLTFAGKAIVDRFKAGGAAQAEARHDMSEFQNSLTRIADEQIRRTFEVQNNLMANLHAEVTTLKAELASMRTQHEACQRELEFIRRQLEERDRTGLERQLQLNIAVTRISSLERLLSEHNINPPPLPPHIEHGQ